MTPGLCHEGSAVIYVDDLKIENPLDPDNLYLVETTYTLTQKLLQNELTLQMPGLNSMIQGGLDEDVAEIVVEQTEKTSSIIGRVRLYDATNPQNLNLLLDSNQDSATIPLTSLGADDELPLIIEGVERGFGALTIRLRHKQQGAQASVQNDQMNYIVFGVDVTWEESVSPLSNNDNEGGGQRIFPDRSDPTDTTARNKIIVRAALDPPLSGFPVHFKVFDVDDPTPSSIDPDDVIDDNGLAGDDNFGDAAELSASMDETDSNGRAEVEMEVGMQPGDNYRMAVSFDPVKLDGLAVDDDTEPGYIPSGQAQLPGFAGKLSPMLTVWRRLWYEFDSMTAPLATGAYEQTNFDVKTVTNVIQDEPPPSINYHFSTLTIPSKLTGDDRQFDEGIVRFPDGVTYPIHYNIGTSVVVIGIAPLSYIDSESNFYDDDWANPSTLKRSLPYSLNGGSVFHNAYEEAFMMPTSVLSQYQQDNIPFDAHVGFGELFDTYKDFADSADFWYATMVAAWQAEELTDDSDDNGVTNGMAYFGTQASSIPGDYGCIYGNL